MKKEKEILELTSLLWSKIHQLEVLHPDDIHEHRKDIHNIQNRVAARMYFKKNN